MSTREEREQDKKQGGGPICGRQEESQPIRRPTPEEARKALGDK